MAIGGVSANPLSSPIQQLVPTPAAKASNVPADFTAPPATDLPFPRLTLATLGLGLPNSQGDAAALFAQVSLALEQTIGDTRDNKLSGYAAALASNLAALANQLTRIAADQKIIEKASAEVANLNSQRDPLVAERDSAQNSSNAVQTSISDKQAAIAVATEHLKTLKPSDPDYATTKTTIDKLNQDVTNLQGQKAIFDKKVSDKNAEIAPLDNKISVQNGVIANTQVDIDAAVNLVQATLDLLSKVLAGIPPSTRLTEAARDVVITRQFEDIFKNLRDSGERIETDKDIQNLAETLGVKQSVVQKIVLAALGLSAGLSNLVDFLRQLQPVPDSGLPDQASVVGGRLQFAV